MKAIFLTIFALVAFAFNSILCRLALGTEAIDAASFTGVRLLSGAFVLLIIYNLSSNKRAESRKGNWLSAFFLFAYAVCFSFAYVSLSTATGALILFGSVQATMLISAVFSGERPGILEWTGFSVAVGGLVYLVFPGLSAPPLLFSILMMFAGIAWGFYTLRGRGSEDPLGETAGNFMRSLPFMMVAFLPFVFRIDLSSKGMMLAVLSGAVASGIGYSVWYTALRYHTASRAAILQLSVPAIAALGGVVFMDEILSMRLIAASTLILGGIAIAVSSKRQKRDR
ncbi:MAG: DMT family transporter [Pyrinomonadaceae bacterium]|nr:DMT family transporter [Pyrinomonadaceae bacterium]